MKEKHQRFIEVLNQYSNVCETCPIYKECQQMPDDQSDSPLYCCEDLLFAYVEQGKDFKNILDIL